VTTYIVRRFIQSILFIFAGALLVYTALVMWMPAGPNWRAERMLEEFRKISAELNPGYTGPISSPELDEIYALYKIDKPWPLSFFAWLFDPEDTVQEGPDGTLVPKGIDVTVLGVQIKGSGILTGDWGTSRWVNRGSNIREMIGAQAGGTLVLVGVALLLSLVIAIPLGVLSAVRQGSLMGHMLTFVSFAGRSIPPYALGTLLVLFLAVIPYQLHTFSNMGWIPYLPAGEAYSLDQENNTINRIYHLILPAFTLSVIQVVWLSRFVRSSMLEVLNQDYIRTARAKGLSRARVIYKHALRNALIPLITVFGLALPGLASGAIIIEQVFSYDGLGRLYYKALGGTLTTVGGGGLGRDEIPPIGNPIDFQVALPITIMLIAVVAFSNMLADIAYTFADPRVEYSSK
jgi:peptide/nickel transport system permease protein